MSSCLVLRRRASRMTFREIQLHPKQANLSSCRLYKLEKPFSWLALHKYWSSLSPFLVLAPCSGYNLCSVASSNPSCRDLLLVRKLPCTSTYLPVYTTRRQLQGHDNASNFIVTCFCKHRHGFDAWTEAPSSFYWHCKSFREAIFPTVGLSYADHFSTSLRAWKISATVLESWKESY